MKQIKHIHRNPQLQLLFAVDNYWPIKKMKWLNRPKTSLKQKKIFACLSRLYNDPIFF